jgi:hypothetical protein
VFYRPARFRTARHAVIDIGLGGLRVYSDEALELGDRLDIELTLPEEKTLTCLVRVVWVKSLPAGGPAPFDVGLELLDAHGDGFMCLSRVLEEV